MKDQRIIKRLTTIIIMLTVMGLLVFLTLKINTVQMAINSTSELTGYTLFTVFVFLGLFNLRKRLSMLPQIGSAYWWHQIHVIFGLAVIPLYLLHIDSWWPEQSYERLIVIFVFNLIISGIVGFIIQNRFPKRLNEIGGEILFERIPDAISEINDATKNIIENSIKETHSETLLHLYQEHLFHYFSKPRYILSHLIGSHEAEFFLRQQFYSIRHLCDTDELEYLQELEALAHKKTNVDKQYAHQLAMKLWLFIHIPAVVGSFVLILWHLLLVNIYAL